MSNLKFHSLEEYVKYNESDIPEELLRLISETLQNVEELSSIVHEYENLLGCSP